MHFSACNQHFAVGEQCRRVQIPALASYPLAVQTPVSGSYVSRLLSCRCCSNIRRQPGPCRSAGVSHCGRPRSSRLPVVIQLPVSATLRRFGCCEILRDGRDAGNRQRSRNQENAKAGEETRTLRLAKHRALRVSTTPAGSRKYLICDLLGEAYSIGRRFNSQTRRAARSNRRVLSIRPIGPGLAPPGRWLFSRQELSAPARSGRDASAWAGQISSSAWIFRLWDSAPPYSGMANSTSCATLSAWPTSFAPALKSGAKTPRTPKLSRTKCEAANESSPACSARCRRRVRS